jgi:hypothetical protein
MPKQSDHVIPLDEAHLYLPHRLCRDYCGPPPVIPATPPPLSPYLPNLPRSVPGAVKPAPLVHTAAHTTAEFSTRFSSPQDSAAPDESSNSFFINRVDRSSGTGEGYSEEQTQARVDCDRKSQARVDHVDYDRGGRSDYEYSLRSDAIPRNDARPRQDARHRTNHRPHKIRQVSNGRASCAKSVVSDFLVSPSPDYQPGDEGLLDAGGAVVRSVDQVTLLSPAAKLDNAAVATPALPLVETVSDDDYVLAGDGICATSADTTPVTTHRPVVWDIRVVKSNVPDAPPDLDFRKYFALSSFSRVHQLEYSLVPDIYVMFLEGAPSRFCRDHKLRDFASVGLMDSNERWVTLFYQQRTNDADITMGIGSRLRGRLLYPDRLIRLMDSNERWVTLFYQQRTNDADITTGIGSRLRGRLLYPDRLIRLMDSNERWVTLFYQKRTNDADITTGIRSRIRGRSLYPDRLIRLQNMSIHGDQSTTPYELCSNLRT